MRKINIQALYDFADRRKKVDPWELADAAESFYRSVKVVGLNDTVVTYIESTGMRVQCSGAETSILLRAFTLHLLRLIYRWDDMRSGRLEKHFGLDLSMYEILAQTGVVTMSGVDLACTNVQDTINKWSN